MLSHCDEAVMFQIVKQRHLDNGTVHKFVAWNILLTPPGGVILLRFLVNYYICTNCWSSMTFSVM